MALAPLLLDVFDRRPHAEAAACECQEDECAVHYTLHQGHPLSPVDHPQKDGHGKGEAEDAEARIDLRHQGRWDKSLKKK